MPEVRRTDCEPRELNRGVNFNNGLLVLFAFQGDPYPFGSSEDTCQDHVPNPCP